MLKASDGGPRRRKFMLCSDVLVYELETGRPEPSTDYPHRKYKAPLKIALRECLILDYGSADSIVIVWPGEKSFVVVAASEKEKQARGGRLDLRPKFVVDRGKV